MNTLRISPQSSRNSVTASVSEIERGDGFWIGRFRAMASPCEVLVEAGNERQARAVIDVVTAEAWRIERKYSRYRTDNVVHAINTSNGLPVVVDEETANLLDFAARLHALSSGRFDITSGALRRVWTFDGGSRIPQQEQIDAVLALVGWHRVSWNRPVLVMQPGMELDFGGVGKEYAVDRAAALVRDAHEYGCLVNFGGDLAISHPRRSGLPWRVGIETANTSADRAAGLIDLTAGALATSGDTYRYVTHAGRRYTHILDPCTGYPIENAPRSVTVAAPTCTQAGMLTTLSLLQGEGAEAFLHSAGVQHWIQR